MRMKESVLKQLADHHQNANNLLTCSICLDLMSMCCLTKCGHVFCRACIENHIRRAKRNARCPLCNKQGLTKRSLEDDPKMCEWVSLFKKLLLAESKDSGGRVDFLEVRVTSMESKESNDNLTVPAGQSKWTPVKQIKDPELPKRKLYNTKARGNIKTYTRAKEEDSGDDTFVFPGERVDCDYKTVNADDSISLPHENKHNRVKDWLQADHNHGGGSYTDLVSQPVGRRDESTPIASSNSGLATPTSLNTPQITQSSTSAPLKKYKFFKTKAATPTSVDGSSTKFTEKLSSVKEKRNKDCTNAENAAFEGRSTRGLRSRGHNTSNSPLKVSVAAEHSEQLIEEIPCISQTVDVNDTFDKLVADKNDKHHIKYQSDSVKPVFLEKEKDATVPGLFHNQSNFSEESICLPTEKAEGLIRSLDRDLKDLTADEPRSATVNSDKKWQHIRHQWEKTPVVGTDRDNEDQPMAKDDQPQRKSGRKRSGEKAAAGKQPNKKRISWQDITLEKSSEKSRGESTMTNEAKNQDEHKETTVTTTKQGSETQIVDINASHFEGILPAGITDKSNPTTPKTTHGSVVAPSVSLPLSITATSIDSSPPSLLSASQEPSDDTSKVMKRRSRRFKAVIPLMSTDMTNLLTPKKTAMPLAPALPETRNTFRLDVTTQELKLSAEPPDTMELIKDISLCEEEPSIVAASGDTKKSRLHRRTVPIAGNDESPMDETATLKTLSVDMVSPKDQSLIKKLRSSEKKSFPVEQKQASQNVSKTHSNYQLSRLIDSTSSAPKSPAKRKTMEPSIIKKPLKRLNKEGRIQFSLLGRTCSKKSKITRERVVPFIQLGLLNTNKSGLPTLQDLVRKRRSVGLQHQVEVDQSVTSHQNVENWLQNIDEVSREQDGQQNKVKTVDDEAEETEESSVQPRAHTLCTPSNDHHSSTSIKNESTCGRASSPRKNSFQSQNSSQCKKSEVHQNTTPRKNKNNPKTSSPVKKLEMCHKTTPRKNALSHQTSPPSKKSKIQQSTSPRKNMKSHKTSSPGKKLKMHQNTSPSNNANSDKILSPGTKSEDHQNTTPRKNTNSLKTVSPGGKSNRHQDSSPRKNSHRRGSSPSKKTTQRNLSSQRKFQPTSSSPHKRPATHLSRRRYNRPTDTDHSPLEERILGETIESSLTRMFSHPREFTATKAPGDNLLQRHISELGGAIQPTMHLNQDQMEDATEELKTPPTKTNHQKDEDSPALSQSSNGSQDELGKATSPPKLQTSSQHLARDGFITPENYSQRPISRSCQHNLDEFGIERQASQESNASLPDLNVPQDFMRGILGANTSDVYSQDKETKSQEMQRLAKMQSLMENEDRSNDGFQQSQNSAPASQKSSNSVKPCKRRKFHNVINSDEESDGEIEEDGRDEIIKDFATPKKSQDPEEVIEIQDSQDQNQRLKASGRKRKLIQRTPLAEVVNRDMPSVRAGWPPVIDLPSAATTNQLRSPTNDGVDEETLNSMSLLSSHTRSGRKAQGRSLDKNRQPLEVNSRQVLSSLPCKTQDKTNAVVKKLAVHRVDTNRNLFTGTPSPMDEDKDEMKHMRDLQKSFAPNEDVGKESALKSKENEDNVESRSHETRTSVGLMIRPSKNPAGSVGDSDEDMFLPTPDEPRRMQKLISKAPELNAVTELDEEESRFNYLEHGGQQALEPEPEKTPKEASGELVPGSGSVDSLNMVPDTECLDGLLSGQQQQHQSIVPATSQIIEKSPCVVKQPTKIIQLRFVVSNLNQSQKLMVNSFVDQFGCGTVASSLDSTTTHVIVGTGKDLHAQRTLKFLKGVSMGVMVVSHLWCERSLQLGTMQDPAHFEALDSELGGATGPRRSRLAKQAGQAPLLTGWEIMIFGEISDIPAGDLTHLITTLGARHIRQFEEFSRNDANAVKVVIVDCIGDFPLEQVLKLLRKQRLAVLDKQWMMESIGGWEVRPMFPHVSDGLKEEDILQAGYSI